MAEHIPGREDLKLAQPRLHEGVDGTIRLITNETLFWRPVIPGPPIHRTILHPMVGISLGGVPTHGVADRARGLVRPRPRWKVPALFPAFNLRQSPVTPYQKSRPTLR